VKGERNTLTAGLSWPRIMDFLQCPKLLWVCAREPVCVVRGDAMQARLSRT